MQGKYTVDEIKNIVAPIAQEYGVDSLYLFGSYSKGSASEKSDIDLRIDLVTSDISDKNFLRLIADEEVLLYRKS